MVGPRDLARFEADFASACARTGKGTLIVFNGAGGAGRAALDRVCDAIDPEMLLSWRTADNGGDCLFTTTYAMVALINAQDERGFRLVTGYFDHPDSPTGERIIHAWLEIGDVVVNVSNPNRRPVYALDRGWYYSRNFHRKKIQSIPAKAVEQRLRRWIRNHGADVDVRAFTHDLLRKTRHVMRMQERRLSQNG